MKKVILGASILMGLLFYLPSCAPVVSPEEYNTLQSRLDNAQYEIDALKANLAALRDNYENLQADYEGLQGDYEGLQDDYVKLRADYESSLERLEQSTLKNPTWSELRNLLEQDDTDTLTYLENSFDCTGFAITLRDHAWRYSIRGAYVEVGFSGKEGHALNCFQTTDKGTVFVACQHEAGARGL